MDDAVTWTDVVTAVATVAAAIGTLATLIFFGLQLRAQSRAIADQREASTNGLEVLTSQLRMQTKQAEIEAAAAELSVNLGVMIRLQEVLYGIADDEDSHKHIWGDPPPSGFPDCRRPVLGVWAMLDVMSIALTASERLPDFSRNAAEDWIQYGLDTLDQSPNVRQELGEPHGLVYWPELRKVLEAYNAGARKHADYNSWLAQRNEQDAGPSGEGVAQNGHSARVPATGALPLP